MLVRVCLQTAFKDYTFQLAGACGDTPDISGPACSQSGGFPIFERAVSVKARRKDKL